MRKVTRIAALMAAMLINLTLAVSAQSYSYTLDGRAVESPDTHLPVKQIKLEYDGKQAVSPQDIFYASSGEIYVADTGNDRILMMDERYNVFGQISSLTDASGANQTLKDPEGVFVTDDGRIYIADTGNKRIVVCDKSGRVSMTVQKPTGLIGIADDAAFNPTKLLVDASDRIYVVARNYNLGILQLDPKGKFVGYVGAPKVQYSIIQMLWRKISTEEQLSKMEQYVPTEYNNIALDPEGFVYGTVGTLDSEKLEQVIASKDTSGSVTPITKLNTNGSDVLKRNGAFAPVGDLEYEENASKIIDVAAGKCGIYAMLDATKGHIFLYDVNGNLLCIFGSNGSAANDFSQASSITFAKDDILVLDALDARVSVFSPTDYGSLIMQAVEHQYNGNFDEAYSLWSEVSGYNRNFEYAFVGLGQAYCNEGEYEKAMECFEYANDKENYSKAKMLLRKESMKTVFPIIFVSMLCIIGAVIVYGIVKKIYRYAKGYDRER